MRRRGNSEKRRKQCGEKDETRMKTGFVENAACISTEKQYAFSDMNKNGTAEKIRGRIAAAQEGTLFVMGDFADIAGKNAANRAVLRLVEEGLLRVIVRGVYQKPRFNAFLGECEEPSADAVARALARKNGWAVCPDGDTALNLLGLSEQVPAAWVYSSDGPYKAYACGAGTIRFRHTANRMLRSLSPETALVVQALRALGKGHVGASVLAAIARRFDAAALAEMERETRNVPDWIHSAIASLAEERSHA